MTKSFLTQTDRSAGGFVAVILLGFPIGLFILVEFANWVVLPITLQTVEVWSSKARTVTGESAAAVAKKREDAKADLEREQARINTARAPFAERYRSAEFRKTTAEGVIASMEEQLRNATIRAEVISTRVRALVDCANAYNASLGPRTAYDFNREWANATITKGGPIGPFLIHRRQCVPGDTTPASAIHSNAK